MKKIPNWFWWFMVFLFTVNILISLINYAEKTGSLFNLIGDVCWLLALLLNTEEDKK